MSRDAIKLGGCCLSTVVGGAIWRFASSRMTNRRLSRQQLADLFEGTVELREAFAVVGQVAINHTGVEDALKGRLSLSA
jgi:hypothetical protein